MDVLLNRATPRKLSDLLPPEDVIQQALRAAEAAPDHGRLKPWRFVRIAGEGRAALGAAMQEALRQRDPAATATQLEEEAKKPLRAPLIIVVAAVLTPSPKVPEVEQLLAAGCAAQNLQLAFHAAGFGVQWKTGPAAADAHLKASLGLAAGDHIVGFMYIGGIAEPGRERAAPDGSRVRHWP